MATDGPTPPPCNKDVYANGTMVMMTAGIPSNAMEEWVKKVAEKSGQPVDWHFAGGRACVLALGDLNAVRQAIAELIPEHNAMIKQRPTIYGEQEINPAHEAARQWNVERGAIQ